MKKWLLKPPSLNEIIRLLMAWRVWVAGAVVGAVLAVLLYFVMPPHYRAMATVLVDQNAEQVVPVQRSDLVIYTFLQRETDKLELIVWSDDVMARVSSQTGVPVSELRVKRLHLSQPSDGGWHFYADAPDPQAASAMASAWAGAFAEIAQSHPAGVNPLLEINYTQAQDLPIQRTVSLGVYVFSGASIGIVLLALGLLFFDRRED